MRAQSVSSAVRARAWQAAIAACSAYGPERAAERLGPLERGQAAADQQLVPAARGSGRAAGSARRPGPTRAADRDAWISISATRPCTSGSFGTSSARIRPSRSASSHSAGPHPVVAGGGRVALVEDQVDDLQHRGQPRRHARRPAAPRTAPARRPACAWPARSAGRWSAPAPGTPGRSRRWSGRRAAAASAPPGPRWTAPDGRR